MTHTGARLPGPVLRRITVPPELDFPVSGEDEASALLAKKICGECLEEAGGLLVRPGLLELLRTPCGLEFYYDDGEDE